MRVDQVISGRGMKSHAYERHHTSTQRKTTRNTRSSQPAQQPRLEHQTTQYQRQQTYLGVGCDCNHAWQLAIRRCEAPPPTRADRSATNRQNVMQRPTHVLATGAIITLRPTKDTLFTSSRRPRVNCNLQRDIYSHTWSPHRVQWESRHTCNTHTSMLLGLMTKCVEALIPFL